MFLYPICINLIDMLYIILPFIPLLADVAVLFIYRGRIRLIDTRYIIALSAGIITTAAMVELIPESNIESNYMYLLLGFILFYVVEKLTMLHSCGEAECEVHTLTPLSVVGMALDNIVDGLGIAIASFIDPWLGFIIALAVVTHEVPQALTSTFILRRLMKPHREVVAMLLLAGLMYPLGGALSIIVPSDLYPAIISFVAGVFIYIGAGDLLMEAHRKFNIYVVISVLTGVALSLILKGLHI